MSELDVVKRRIQKLTAKTVHNSCTEGEALAAAHMIGVLLDTYNLSMDEVMLGKEECKKVVYKIEGRKSRHPVDSCVVRLAEFCDCFVWFNTGRGEYCFFGLEKDTELALYLTDVVRKAIDHETALYKKSSTYANWRGHRKTITTAFAKGMSYRLSNRFKAMIEERKQNLRKNALYIDNKTSTDIVLLKKAKVKSAFDKYKSSDGLKLKKKKVSLIRSGLESFHDGMNAAEKISLNRPINHSDNPTKLLT